jgi:hypothetical protein
MTAPQGHAINPTTLRQRAGAGYRFPVPPVKRKTPQRTIAVEQDLWDEFGAASKAAGFDDRAAVMRQFIRWYTGKGQLPQRPE